MGPKQENPLPEEDDDTKLAKQFGEFFLSKVINIRKLFHSIPPYKTQQDTVPRLDKLSTISEADLKTIINQMPKQIMSIWYLKNSNIQKGNRYMYSSNHQGHQPITGQRRILCKLETAVVKPLIKAR